MGTQVAQLGLTSNIILPVSLSASTAADAFVLEKTATEPMFLETALLGISVRSLLQ